MTYPLTPRELCRNKCECTDMGCPVHLNTRDCRNVAGTILYRIDMEDITGTAMCEGCAEDAQLTGLFTDQVETED